MKINNLDRKPMRVLYIYRNPKMGYSIGKVFRPIERAMREKCEVDSIEMPCYGYSLKSLYRNIRYVRNVLSKTHYDIVHITGTEHYLLPFLQKYKTVVTVHDLGFYTSFKKSLKLLFKYLLWIRTIPMASMVTFISNKSKEEANEFVTINENNLRVIYDPIGDEYVYIPKKINRKEPIILHLGTNPHKNLKRTIKALNKFPCKLVIIGKINNNYKKLLEENCIKYENKCGLTDEEILVEYKKCDLVSFPSLHEGFGMPIIEGQSVGRPVLTSNITPMKEISGGGAVLVNPESVDSIREGYIELLANSEMYIQVGLENVKRFRLNVIVAQYYDIYKKLMK